jgi:hypothetical protein
MSYSTLHDKKKVKNYALLAILVGVISLFFILAMVKVKIMAG